MGNGNFRERVGLFHIFEKLCTENMHENRSSVAEVGGSGFLFDPLIWQTLTSSPF